MVRIKNRRAQNAAGAAVLIAAIAAIIIAYILFLSPEDRAALLGETPPGGTYPGGTRPGGPGLAKPVVLLQENIGKLSISQVNSIEHSIPSTKILTQVHAGEITRVESLHIQAGAFEDKTKSVKFKLEQEISSNLLLSFNVRTAKGRLKISLNGQEISNSHVSEQSPRPIPLDRTHLKPENELVFSVSSPGAAFWRINEYELESILVSADITDYSRSFAEKHFSISENEYDNLEKAELKYTPNCVPGTTSPLLVVINGNTIFGALPLCNAVNTVETAKELLRQGDNVLTFQSNAGVFEINNIKLKTYLKKPVEPTYYFDVPPDLYDYVLGRKADVILLLRFPDGEKLKQATISVNGARSTMRTTGAYYHTRISSHVRDGSNSIRITPAADSLDITEMRVEIG